MSRYKTNSLMIQFGNVVILPENGVLADTTTEMSMEFSTEVTPTVGGAPHISNHGNTTWRLPLDVVEDFNTRDEAFRRQILIADGLETESKQGQEVHLLIRDGNSSCSWVAGITSADFSITLSGREGAPFRLMARYEFVLGSKVGMENM